MIMTTPITIPAMAPLEIFPFPFFFDFLGVFIFLDEMLLRFSMLPRLRGPKLNASDTAARTLRSWKSGSARGDDSTFEGRMQRTRRRAKNAPMGVRKVKRISAVRSGRVGLGFAPLSSHKHSWFETKGKYSKR
jgi:hypothetical protein